MQCNQVNFLIVPTGYGGGSYKLLAHSIFKNILTLYSFRYRILEENGDTVRAAGLCIELGNALLSVGKNGEAASFYQRAADLRSDYIGLEYVHAREKVASCQIGKNKIFKSFSIQSLNVSPSIYSNLKKPLCL